MFSVIIPTLNEEKYLPRLLESIEQQKLRPAEIIVADNHSKDRTRDIAKEHGCIVVDGGFISEARNRGAAVASQDILVFLDADTVLPDRNTFSQLIGTFIAKDADIGSCYAKNIKDESPLPTPSHVMFNTTKRLNKLTYRTAGTIVGELGFCVVTRRELFKKIGGFNENIHVMEDSDFFHRAIKTGASYTVVPIHLGVSDRRFAKRSIVSTLKVAAFVTVIVGGMFVGWKQWQKFLEKYEQEKGPLGGSDNP